MGNVTKNMYVYQFGQDILIIDCGIGFPDSQMLGVDILIPDIGYLKGKEHRIVGMLLTHAHDDHIAGLPYILPQLKHSFPIWGSKLTLGFAKDRLQEHGTKANFRQLPEQTFNIGPFKIQSIYMTHSVPDSRHFAITVAGITAYHGSDYKIDLNPVDHKRPDLQKIALIGSQGVNVLLSDCLNAELADYSKSESELETTFDQEMQGVKGQVIFTIVSSNIHRIQTIADLSVTHGRKLFFVGRSIERNVKTAQSLGFLKLPANVTSKRKIKQTEPHQTCIIIAGSQGQIGSSLSRAAEGEHSLVRIKAQDKVIFASEAIPGNEQNVYAAIDSISKIGADVAYSDIVEIHASGHSSAIEQQLLISLIKPKEIVPIGGTYHHMIAHRRLARKLGYPDKHIHLLDNGQILEVGPQDARVSGTIHLHNIMVDGLGIGDVGQIVLRDRQKMAEDGIVAILVPVSQQTGQIGGDIEIISRGFVYIKESQALIDKIKQGAKACIPQKAHVVTNWQSLRKKIETSVEKVIFNATQRRPLLLTVIIEV